MRNNIACSTCIFWKEKEVRGLVLYMEACNLNNDKAPPGHKCWAWQECSELQMGQRKVAGVIE